MCLLNNASDEGLARRYTEALKDRARFSATPKQKALGQFTVRHYAGEVRSQSFFSLRFVDVCCAALCGGGEQISRFHPV